MNNFFKNSPAGFFDFGSCESNIVCIKLLEAYNCYNLQVPMYLSRTNEKYLISITTAILHSTMLTDSTSLFDSSTTTKVIQLITSGHAIYQTIATVQLLRFDIIKYEN